jgi:hypothetical protein
MKPLLRFLSVLSIVLFCQFGRAADLLPSASAAPTQVAAAAQDLRSKTPPVLSTVQMAIIDGSRNGSGSLRDELRPIDKSPTEGLPSTPIALATLLLMICILIGRRNS